MQQTNPNIKPRPSNPDTDAVLDAAETLEIFGAAEETVAAAARAGELTSFSVIAEGEDRGARSGPVVVIKNP